MNFWIMTMRNTVEKLVLKNVVLAFSEKHPTITSLKQVMNAEALQTSSKF